MKYLSYSAEETEALGCRLAAQIKRGMVLACRGGLGVGKTALTRGIARGLGYEGRVTSPTFTIVNEYLAPIPLFHFDMYRMDSSNALFDIGWDEYLDRDGVCVVEWSEKVEDALPQDVVTVEFRRGEADNERIICVTGGGF